MTIPFESTPANSIATKWNNRDIKDCEEEILDFGTYKVVVLRNSAMVPEVISVKH